MSMLTHAFGLQGVGIAACCQNGPRSQQITVCPIVLIKKAKKDPGAYASSKREHARVRSACASAYASECACSAVRVCLLRCALRNVATREVLVVALVVAAVLVSCNSYAHASSPAHATCPSHVSRAFMIVHEHRDSEK
eukprot:854416-Pleurochrysis_carterae.AAC.6